MARASLIVDRTPGVPMDDRNRPIIEVARHPHDLERHALRIRSAQTPGEAYGALVDLFIATAPMHAKLRQLALDEHGALLDDAQRAALADAAADGLTPASPIPACPDSLFTAGVTSGLRLVLDAAADVAAVAGAGQPPTDLDAPSQTPTPMAAMPSGAAPWDDRLVALLGLALAGALLATLRRWFSRRAAARR